MRNVTVRDSGPTYAETDMDRLPVEPWSAVSNVVFLFVAVYWWRRTRFRFRDHPVIVAGLPILVFGFVGGTLYHTLRNSDLWLILDMLPILVLALLAAVYLWKQTLKSRLLACMATLAPPVAMHLLAHGVNVPRRMHIALGYSGLALMILTPALVHCAVKNWAHWRWLAGALAAFAAAIVFRTFDAAAARAGMPMGTHFLWHTFGGMSTFCMLAYLYHADNARRPGQNTQPDDTPCAPGS